MKRLRESRPSLLMSSQTLLHLAIQVVRLQGLTLISKSFFSLSDVLLGVFFQVYSSKHSYSSTRKRNTSPNILWHKTLSSTTLTSILSTMAIRLKKQEALNNIFARNIIDIDKNSKQIRCGEQNLQYRLGKSSTELKQKQP